jgi:hypothetical protein
MFGKGNTYRPTYMEARLPTLADWMIHPTMVIFPAQIKAVRRPKRSETHDAMKQPKKQPA